MTDEEYDNKIDHLYAIRLSTLNDIEELRKDPDKKNTEEITFNERKVRRLTDEITTLRDLKLNQRRYNYEVSQYDPNNRLPYDEELAWMEHQNQKRRKWIQKYRDRKESE